MAEKYESVEAIIKGPVKEFLLENVGANVAGKIEKMTLSALAEQNLRTDLGLESMDISNMVLTLERKFDISYKIPDEVWDSSRTAGYVADEIFKLIS